MPRRTKAIVAIMCSGLLLYFIMSPVILAYPLLYSPKKFPAGKYDIAALGGAEPSDELAKTNRKASIRLPASFFGWLLGFL